MFGNKGWAAAAIAAGLLIGGREESAAQHDHGTPAPAQAAHDHAGHSQPAPSPGQPAKTLSPDALDSPAATSVLDARRAEAMAQAGSHAGHGRTYTHVDAGRGEAQAPEKKAPEKKTAAVYACPMHPEVTSDAPGTCPKCGMALAERREE